MSTNDRKYHDKEAFVSGHSGSSSYEILLLCMVIPTGLQLYYKLFPFLDDKIKKIGLEFVTLILPMVAVQTSLLNANGHVMLLSGMLLLSSLLPGPKLETSNSNETKRPTFLSIHRSSVYLLTTIAILAVDFPLFPRRYCKTETMGYGWMDLGAASFVIIAGWTCALSSHNSSRGSSMKAIKKCTPLFLLGVIRLLTNKGLEYQEHVSEYGVHWNFFFTLCFMEAFMIGWKRAKCLFSSKIPLDGIVALATMISYQIYLSFGGQDFIENGERRCTSDLNEAWTLCNVFYANREGILGLVGYVSIRLLSEEIGQFCFVSKPERTELRQWRLVVTTVLLWALHLALTTVIQLPTSRRSTNLPFALWALAHNMTILSLIDYIITHNCRINNNKPPQIPCILNAVNRHGLAVFLLSNILTGLVNLTIDTLHASELKALAVLFVYLALVCGCSLLLDHSSTKGSKLH
jgi:phosphatidylinositol glycan class W